MAATLPTKCQGISNMTTPDIDADAAKARLRNQLNNAAAIREAVAKALSAPQEETEALAEEAVEFDQTDSSPNTNG